MDYDVQCVLLLEHMTISTLMKIDMHSASVQWKGWHAGMRSKNIGLGLLCVVGRAQFENLVVYL